MKLRENFSKDFPCKFTPALVLHVLHFIVDFFYNPRASLARTEFKRDFLDNHGARRSIAFKTFFDLVKWKSGWVSEWVKWCLFWSLNFFIFRYVEGGVLGNNYISIKKCTTTFLWVLNFGQVGEILEFSKTPSWREFLKNGFKSNFWKNFTRDFPVKNEKFLLEIFT